MSESDNVSRQDSQSFFRIHSSEPGKEIPWGDASRQVDHSCKTVGPGRTVVMVGSCTHVAASVVHCLFLSSVDLNTD